MIKTTATATLAALALAAAPSAHAYRASFYPTSDDCSGTKAGTVTGDSGTCIDITDEGDEEKSYIHVVCASNEASSSWTFQIFRDDDTCNSTATTPRYDIQGSGTDCKEGAEVDCSASACYAGTTSVRLEGEAEVPMSQLNPGDRVLSADEDGNLFYDKVFRVTHWDQDTTASVYRLTTESGNTLELTGDHYVHVGGLEHENLKLASEVAAGDELFVVGKDGEVTVSTVATAEPATSKGLFNVHTLSSRVVVNGVVGSHFSKESSWGSSNGFASLWYKAVDTVSSLFGAENARLDE